MNVFLLKECVALQLEVRWDTPTPSKGKTEQRGRLRIPLQRLLPSLLSADASLLTSLYRKGNVCGSEAVFRGFPSVRPKWNCQSFRVDRPVIRQEQLLCNLIKLYSICANMCVVFSFWFLCGHLVTFQNVWFSVWDAFALPSIFPFLRIFKYKSLISIWKLFFCLFVLDQSVLFSAMHL